MVRYTVTGLLAVACCLVGTSKAFAYGRGGAGGGFHAASVSTGGYRGAEVHGVSAGGYRGVEVGGARGAEVGGVRAGEVGGVRVGEVGGSRAGAVSADHGHISSDFGFSHVAGGEGARGYVATGHFTTPYSGSVLAGRGAAVRGGYYHYGNGAYGSGWWAGHPAAWRPFGWDAGACWGWATAPLLGTWFGWNAPPVYYDFGTTIVYQGDQVYINDQPGPTATQYYQQAADLAVSQPPPDKADDKWQPLGVFSLVQGEQTDASAIFQLAVTKAGMIGGNYCNVLTNTTLPVRGAVDPKTQRASWIVGDEKATVYDTGIYNLTKDESPVLIHFGKDRTQQWLLVRIKDADAKVPATAADDAKLPAAKPEAGIAKITLIVPADAEVYFNGSLTTQIGTERSYVTPSLEAGVDYDYSIRARWTVNGQPVEKTRKVGVKAGADVRVDFTGPQ